MKPHTICSETRRAWTWRLLVAGLVALVGAPATGTALALEETGLLELPADDLSTDPDLEQPMWRTADYCEYQSRCRCNSSGTQCYRRDGSSYNQWGSYR